MYSTGTYLLGCPSIVRDFCIETSLLTILSSLILFQTGHSRYETFFSNRSL